MPKIKKGDTVQVMKGEDRGKKGKVIMVFTAKNTALVENINLVKKHRRRSQQDQQAGIVSLEAGLSLANLGVVCRHCNRPTRVGLQVLTDGNKVRICKHCKEVL